MMILGYQIFRQHKKALKEWERHHLSTMLEWWFRKRATWRMAQRPCFQLSLQDSDTFFHLAILFPSHFDDVPSARKREIGNLESSGGGSKPCWFSNFSGMNIHTNQLYIWGSAGYIGAGVLAPGDPFKQKLVGGLEHVSHVSIYWEVHNPNWRTPSFFRGVGPNHQPDTLLLIPHPINCPGHQRTLGADCRRGAQQPWGHGVESTIFLDVYPRLAVNEIYSWWIYG